MASRRHAVSVSFSVRRARPSPRSMLLFFVQRTIFKAISTAFISKEGRPEKNTFF